METKNYQMMKETLKYMKEMGIPKDDRRSLIKDCYGPLGDTFSFLSILRDKTIDVYEHSPLTGKHAKNALEKSLKDEASRILEEREGNNFYSSDAL